MNIKLELKVVMKELEQLGREQIKKIYLRHGAKEPLFGVTTGDLKPLSKKYMHQHDLALSLYQTGNYDAMYFAGMICDPLKMSEENFDEWIAAAYCQGLSDFTVALTLAQSPLAMKIADQWINSFNEHYMSAGWSCYEWLLGYKNDEYFDKNKIYEYLLRVELCIHEQSNWVKYAMNNFIIAVGISYLPLHKEAVAIANRMKPPVIDFGKTSCKIPVASDYIQRAIDRKRIGFKRKRIRC